MKRPETLEELAARLGCSLDTARMFQRKPRAKKASALGDPRGTSAQIAAMAGPEAPGFDHASELFALTVRVGELEREKSLLTIRVRVLTEQLDVAAPILDEATAAGVEMERDLTAALREEGARVFRQKGAAWYQRRRARRSVAFRGGSRVRDLRHSLRLARLMLARKGAGGLRLNRLSLVGGREQLRQRLAELPSVGNPYASIPGKGRAS